ncbi:HD domain-containing protein [Deinococcus sp. RM]|uniref:HD domain-containing protein n=1 Tax=Deinococcus sp. RM TaxID=2316359 RepID=UPI00351154F0
MPDFPLTERFLHALARAHHWHAGQYRKVPEGDTPTVPYLSHLLGVASIALEFGATEGEAIAALLHDALEDGPENIQTDVARRDPGGTPPRDPAGVRRAGRAARRGRHRGHCAHRRP